MAYKGYTITRIGRFYRVFNPGREMLEGYYGSQARAKEGINTEIWRLEFNAKRK
jgi:hypothetical protein